MQQSLPDCSGCCCGMFSSQILVCWKDPVWWAGWQAVCCYMDEERSPQGWWEKKHVRYKLFYKRVKVYKFYKSIQFVFETNLCWGLSFTFSFSMRWFDRSSSNSTGFMSGFDAGGRWASFFWLKAKGWGISLMLWWLVMSKNMHD